MINNNRNKNANERRIIPFEMNNNDIDDNNKKDEAAGGRTRDGERMVWSSGDNCGGVVVGEVVVDLRLLS